MLTTIAGLRLKTVRDNIRALTYAEMMELAVEIRNNLVDAGSVDETAITDHEVADALSYAARDREYNSSGKAFYAYEEQADGAA